MSGVDDATSSLMASLVGDSQSDAPITNSYIDGTNLQQINIQTYSNGHPTDQVISSDFKLLSFTLYLYTIFICVYMCCCLLLYNK